MSVEYYAKRFEKEFTYVADGVCKTSVLLVSLAVLF